jgi:hypothetical protein
MSQVSYSTLWDGFETSGAAKLARDAHYRTLREQGVKARRFFLKNQLRQYAGLGQPDGRSCDVYFVEFDAVAAADVGLFARCYR